jgi:osmotically inducible protein OsmC
MEKLYTATVNAVGGRNGHIKSSDGILDMELRKPKELDGQGGASNPEQLFAAAWGACYLGALGSVAEREGVDTTEANVNVQMYHLIRMATLLCFLQKLMFIFQVFHMKKPNN